MKKSFFLLLFVITFVSCQNIIPEKKDPCVSSFPEVADLVLPSVVQVTVIDTKKQKIPEGWDFSYNPFNPSPESLENNEKEFKDEGLASGIIVRKEENRYYILTNKHVIGNADEISVKTIDGNIYKASLSGIDERKDLALLHIDTINQLPVIKWGNSDNLRVGEWVIAVGSPYGYDSSVTAGIVSALGRKNTTGDNISDFIQTDASINHGNSGGALVNLNGELIGVNSWITTPTGGSIGLGFALPSNNAVKTVSDIVKYGEVRYGWIGLIGGYLYEYEKTFYNINKNIKGVFVFETVIDDPAYKYGIMPGDYIISVNGIKITDVDTFTRIIGNTDADTEIEITCIRNNKEQTIKVKTELRAGKDELADRDQVYWPGFSVLSIDNENINIVETLNFNDGVIVSYVEKNPFISLFEIGDIIVEINNSSIKNSRDFYYAINNFKEKNIIKFYRDNIEYIKELNF